MGLRPSRNIRCPNCGRKTYRAHSCRWCNYPILLAKASAAERPAEQATITGEGSSGFFYGYIVVILACLILTVTQGMYYSFGVFFKPLSEDFGWTRAMTSGAFSLCVVMHGFLYIFTGKLNDTIGPRFVLTICGISLGLGYILLSQVSTLWQFYLFYGLVVAIGISGGYIPMLSTVSRWFVKRRGLMTGIVASGTGFGTLLVPLIANWLISEYNWRTSYLVVGIAAIAVIVLLAQFLRRDPGQVGQVPYGQEASEVENGGQGTSGLSLGEAIRTMPFWAYTLAMVCFAVCLFVVMAHIVPHATDLGISETRAAGILAIIGASGIIGRVTLGGLLDKIGSKRTFIICFVLTAITLVLLMMARELWMFYLFAAVFGVAYGGWATAIAPLVADLFGLRSHGVILGSVTFGGALGGAVGPVLAGRIFDVTGSYELAFIICIVLSVIGLVAASFLKPAVGTPRQSA